MKKEGICGKKADGSAIKPPLGLMPKKVHDQKRFTDVRDAIARYCEAGLEINIEWIIEYNQLIQSLRS